MPVPPLFFIVPLTPGISLWISTKVEFYCPSAYPVLHKGPSLNLRREVFILWHSVTCVNTWIIIDGLNDGKILTLRRQVAQEGNGILSPQSVAVLAGVKPLSAHTFQSETQKHADQNVAPLSRSHEVLTAFSDSQVYRQDCETFGMVVKMLVAKDPNLEKQLQVPLRENLGEIRERCLEDLKHFISELDEAVRQQEPSVCDSTTPSAPLTAHKALKPGANHSSSYWDTQTKQKLENFAQTRTMKGAAGWQMQPIRWTDFGLLNGFYSTAMWGLGDNAVMHCGDKQCLLWMNVLPPLIIIAKFLFKISVCLTSLSEMVMSFIHFLKVFCYTES